MKKRIRQHSLQVKLVVYVMLMVTLLIGMSTFVVSLAYQDYAKQTLLDNADGTLRALSYGISAALEFGDRELISESLELLRNAEVFVSADVLNQDGEPYVSARFKDAVSTHEFREHLLPLSVPVINETQTVIGSIKARITTMYLEEEMVQDIRRIVVGGMIFLLASAFLTFTLAGNFLRPLLELKKGIEHMTTLGTFERLPVTSADEIGDLAASFNQMSDTLKNTMTSRDRLLEEVERRKQAQQELQDAQDQLLQAEKMASIGQLAAGVAHEINNPIGYVNGNVQALVEYVAIQKKWMTLIDTLKSHVDAGETDKARQALTEIREYESNEQLHHIWEDTDALLKESLEGLGRVTKIVLDLKTFSRSDQGAEERIQMDEVIAGVLNIVHNEIKYKCTLNQDLRTVPPVRCSYQKLSQVLVNLIINAAQACEKNGEITVRTFEKNGKVCVDVQDNGVGIPPDHLPKIFDPFFTTKPVGEGTGLGLSISYEIIKKSGGEIRVASEPGKGTTFTLVLPPADNGKKT